MAALKRLVHLKRRGSALCSALSISAILFVVGTGMLSLGLHGQTLAIRTGDEIEARCAADAGLIKAIFEMNEKLAVQPWDDSTLPQATDEALPNCDATFSYTVTEDDDGGFSIVATGKAGREETAREVSCTLKLQGLFEYALLVKNEIALKTGTVIDGYNYDADDGKLKVGTNSTRSSSINVGSGAVIDGDVVVGVGGDPDVVINASGATITGSTYEASQEYEFGPITCPAWLASSGSGGAITNTTTITTSGKYDSITLGKGEEVNIDGPVTLYVTGNISLSNTCEIHINNANPDAYLILYLGGNLYLKNGGTVNNRTQDATRLKVLGFDSCTNLSFGTTGVFYGAIYAPNADISMKNSVDIFGAVVADNFYQAASSDFHYDAALRDASVNDEYVHFVIEKWRE